MTQYGLTAYDAGDADRRPRLGRFLRGRREGPRRQARRQLDHGRFLRRVEKTGKDISESPIPAAHLGELSTLSPQT